MIIITYEIKISMVVLAMSIKKFPFNMILWTVASSLVVGMVIILFTTSDIRRNSEGISVTNNISFVLKDYNGNLALFRGNSDEPYVILDEKTSFLNEYDRNRVVAGISVNTRNELEKLIEDMTG